jgi:hypothetical protein
MKGGCSGESAMSQQFMRVGVAFLEKVVCDWQVFRGSLASETQCLEAGS